MWRPHLSRAFCGLTNLQISRGLVNPHFSTFAVEASASQVVGLFPAVNESAPPVFEQVYQEQIAADPGSFECTQQRTVENIVHVPIPQIQVQFVEGVKEIHQERLPGRIEELIVCVAPIPHSVEDIPVPQEQLIAEETTLNTSSTSTSNATPGVPSATPIPVIEGVTPAPVVTFHPVIEYVSEDAAQAAPTFEAGYTPAGACAAPSPAPAVPIPHIQEQIVAEETTQDFVSTPVCAGDTLTISGQAHGYLSVASSLMASWW